MFDTDIHKTLSAHVVSSILLKQIFRSHTVFWERSLFLKDFSKVPVGFDKDTTVTTVPPGGIELIRFF